MGDRTLEAKLVFDARAELAEGPVWDDRRARLWWVDIMAGIVHLTDPATGTDSAIPVGQPIGALGLRERGSPVLAVRDGFASLREEGGLDLIAEVESDDPTMRMNDGKVGPDGGFWAGTMGVDERPGAGGLYRLDPHGSVDRLLGGTTISNGLDWSADGRLFYYIDTPTRRVDRFDVGTDGRRLSGRRVAVDLGGNAAGMPDGMTVDADGYLWVCLWDGWAVERYSPDGRLDRRIEIPAAQVTSCAFGGPNLDELYITTAQEGFPAGGRANQPHAGSIFRVRPGVRGRPSHLFAGDA
jgi:sugar lactone lactonase YvrE